MIGKMIILIVSFLAFGFNSFGMGVVTDPGSYAYYAEQVTALGKQLEKATTMISKAEENIESVNKVKTEVSGVGDQLKGSYDRANGLVGQIKGVRDKLENSPTTIQGQYDKWKDLGFVDPQKSLEEFFKDPRADNADVYQALDRKHEVQQTALKNSIINAENLLQAAPDRLKKIEDLAAMIDQTKNVKDATDLTNRLLVEMLLAVEDLKMLVAYLGEAQGLLNYSGVSKEVTDARKAEVAAHNAKKKKGPMDAMFRAQGLDPDATGDEALRKAMGL